MVKIQEKFIDPDNITTISDFFLIIKEDYNKWSCDKYPNAVLPWFRGDTEGKELIPELYKTIKKAYEKVDENDIIQEFRMRARGLTSNPPPFDRIDEWLFLMQHCDMKTRLLDWTQGALIALFFAIYNKVKFPTDKKGVVYMLNPLYI